MFTIAFFGEFQHELSAQFVKKLVEFAKNSYGRDVLLVCNANGIFKRASNISSQVAMLFDNGIDYIFSGESTISRQAGRKELLNRNWPILAPMNFADSSLNTEILELTIQESRLRFINCIQATGKFPADDEIILLNRLLSANNNTDVTIVNLNGADLSLKEAIAHKYAASNKQICFIGNGTSQLTFAKKINKSIFVADCGCVKAKKSLDGMTINDWWSWHICKERISHAPPQSEVVADLTVITYNLLGELEIVEQKRVVV